MSTMNKNYFYLSQALYGKKLIIKINNQGFCYNHDEIVNANKERFSEGGSAYRSWSKNRFYSKTNGFLVGQMSILKKYKIIL